MLVDFIALLQELLHLLHVPRRCGPVQLGRRRWRTLYRKQRLGWIHAIAIAGSLLHRLLLGCFCGLGWGRGLGSPAAAGGG
ncbi:MAG: hypothetical protein OXE74_09545 [Cyanobacteria bacterium MAG CAR2_bin_4]|nr:hypothetical protein [Cyanobacteria bacterium MAG CAR2_bin_4]